MVVITNGVDTFEVTRGAFNSIFKKQGFSEVASDKVDSNQHNNDDENVKQDEASNEEDDAVKEIEEKPISKWTTAEVKRYAAAKGISLTGTKSIDEAKERIKAAMD